jgi:hypothetical protein
MIEQSSTSHFDIAQHNVASETVLNRIENLAIDAFAVGAAVLIAPVAAAVVYGPRVVDNIKKMPASKIVVKIASTLQTEETVFRRSQVLRSKNRFVANPDKVSLRETHFMSASDCGTPLGHRPQEDLRA